MYHLLCECFFNDSMYESYLKSHERTKLLLQVLLPYHNHFVAGLEQFLTRKSRTLHDQTAISSLKLNIDQSEL